MSVRKEDGTHVAQSSVSASHSDLHQLSSSIAMLRWVDAYGDLILNHYQVDQLVTELESALAESQAHRDLVTEMQRLCEVTLARPHRYLWFVGD